MFRSIFQQPLVNVKQAISKYTWYDFILNEQLFFKHVSCIIIIIIININKFLLKYIYILFY